MGGPAAAVRQAQLVHALTGQSGRLIGLTLTAGRRGDAPQAEPLLESFEPGQIGTVIADAAYDSDAVRKQGKRLGAKACIKPKPTRKRKKRCKRRLLRVGSNPCKPCWCKPCRTIRHR